MGETKPSRRTAQNDDPTARNPSARWRGEATVSISFVHDAPGKKPRVVSRSPADGTGRSMAPSSKAQPDNAKKFYEWR
jgi:hypothetical protein